MRRDTARTALVILVVALRLAFLRLVHGATKCATLGVGCTVLAVAIQFADMETTTAAILIVGFLFLAASVAAHMIG